MRAVVAGMLLAVLPATAWGQAAAPSALDQGAALRREGHVAEAIPLLEQATRKSPKDADAWLNLGLAYAVTKRLDEADSALDRAAALAPNYVDVQIARARVAYFRSDPAEAGRRLAPVLAAHPDSQEAQDLKRKIEAARSSGVGPWRLDVGYTRGKLSRNLPEAHSALISLTHRFDNGRALGISVESARQFGNTDTYGEITYAIPRIFVAIGGAVDADFRPQWAVRAGIYADALSWGEWRVQPLVDVIWARYRVGDVRTITPGLDLEQDRFIARLRWINVVDEADEYQGGYSLYGEWKTSAPLGVFAGWADAPESTEGRTVRVKTASGGFAWEANQATTWRLTLAHEERQAYDREDVSVSVTQRF